jgi:hypothetical protein
VETLCPLQLAHLPPLSGNRMCALAAVDLRLHRIAVFHDITETECICRVFCSARLLLRRFIELRHEACQVPLLVLPHVGRRPPSHHLISRPVGLRRKVYHRRSLAHASRNKLGRTDSRDISICCRDFFLTVAHKHGSYTSSRLPGVHSLLQFHAGAGCVLDGGLEHR